MGIVGIDEVGRGSWAGPLVAGAVLLDTPIPGLRDSKILSQQQRNRLDAEIRVGSVDFGLGWVWPVEIDALGLTAAVGLAMKRAIAEIKSLYDEIIIDGSINYLTELTGSRAIIKADATIPSVSAASIIAKVARDKYMSNLAAKYVGYGFDRHVGYGTAYHQQQLQKLGICDQHRKSFQPIQKMLQGD